MLSNAKRDTKKMHPYRSWKNLARREFQFLDFMGIDVFANEVFRHFSNLIAKDDGSQRITCYTASRLYGELLTIIYLSTCRYSIYNIGKLQKSFFDRPVCQGSIGVGSSISLIGRFWIAWSKRLAWGPLFLFVYFFNG